MICLRKSRFINSFLLLAVLAGGCRQVNDLNSPTVRPASLRDVPAGRLGYRFEPDVLAPPEVEQTANLQIEKLVAVQADFDQNRGQEILERTILSPDKQRALAVYQGVADDKSDFKLDLYDTGGRLIRKITAENLALRFPDSIAWAPDGSSFVFAGARRVSSAANQEITQEAPPPPSLENEAQNQVQPPDADAPPAPILSPSPVSNVLAFRTEQIYLANRDGGELRVLTQTDGLIYFKMIWSPDAAMLAALACKESEWNSLQAQATGKGEIFKPFGRPRILEKNGRERRLDDALTNVDPVWSPDSSKIAVAFDKQIRVYDALGNNPTAAAIPLQVPLLIAAKSCAEKIALNQSCVNAAPIEVNVNNITEQPTAAELTIYLPIVAVKWTDDKTFYLQTGLVVNYTDGEGNRSFLRWHRLNFSPQIAALK